LEVVPVALVDLDSAPRDLVRAVGRQLRARPTHDVPSPVLQSVALPGANGPEPRSSGGAPGDATPGLGQGRGKRPLYPRAEYN